MPVRRRLKIDKSNVAEIGFDYDTNEMHVVFSSLPQTLYIYQRVPVKMFLEVINAEHVGKYFADNIRKTCKDFTKQPL